MSSYQSNNLYSKNFERTNPLQKNSYKKISSQMVETNLDFADSFAQAHEILNQPQHSQLRSNPLLNQKLDLWYAEIQNTNLNHRKNLGRLMTDLKYIVGSIPNSNQAYDQMDIERDGLRSNWDSDLANRYPQAKVDDKLQDILRVVYPNYRPPTNTYVQPQPQTVVINQPPPQSTTVYVQPPVQPTLQTTYVSPTIQHAPLTSSNYVSSQPSQPVSQTYRIDQNGNKILVTEPTTTTYRSESIPPIRQSQISTERERSLTPTRTIINNQPTSPTPVSTTISRPAPAPQADLILDQATINMLTEAKRDYGTPQCEFFDVSDSPTKVECSKDGQSILYGGESFGLCSVRNGWVINEGVLYENKCATIKSLDNGDTLVNNFENWDLVLLDKNLAEKGKLSGVGRAVPQNYKKIKTRNSEDEKSLLWLSGPENLSLVNTGNLSSKEIRQFWRYNGRAVEPVACAISPSGRKVVGIGALDKTHTLHYYDGNDSVTVYQREDITDTFLNWECLEIAYDEDIVFIGGGESSNGSYGNGVVMALTLNDDCDLVREKVLPGVRSVSAIRRHNEGDVLFAGAMKNIFVLFWHQKQLHILNQIPVAMDKFPRDIAFNPKKNEVYSVFDADKGLVVYFEKGALNNRGFNKPAPNPLRPKRKLGQPIIQEKVIVEEPTVYDPLNQGYLTYEQRMKLVKKPPRWTNLFRDYQVKQINLPGSIP